MYFCFWKTDFLLCKLLYINHYGLCYFSDLYGVSMSILNSIINQFSIMIVNSFDIYENVYIINFLGSHLTNATVRGAQI